MPRKPVIISSCARLAAITQIAGSRPSSAASSPPPHPRARPRQRDRSPASAAERSPPASPIRASHGLSLRWQSEASMSRLASWPTPRSTAGCSTRSQRAPRSPPNSAALLLAESQKAPPASQGHRVAPRLTTTRDSPMPQRSTEETFSFQVQAHQTSGNITERHSLQDESQQESRYLAVGPCLLNSRVSQNVRLYVHFLGCSPSRCLL